MSDTSNTPIVLDPNHGPIPIVITGTMPRDRETLKLVSYLNALTESGKAAVHYFPASDNSEPVLTAVDSEHTRTVNPIRVPEDLVVPTDIGSSTESDYYKDVQEHLDASGTPCVVLAYPSNSTNIGTTLQFKFEGKYSDIDNDFSQGKDCSCRVQYNQTLNFLDVPGLVDLVDPANAIYLHLLSGPEVATRIYDRQQLKDAAAEATPPSHIIEDVAHAFEPGGNTQAMQRMMRPDGTTVDVPLR